MRRAAILFVWWFFWYTPYGGGMIGPFESYADCEKVRPQANSSSWANIIWSKECWETRN